MNQQQKIIAEFLFDKEISISETETIIVSSNGKYRKGKDYDTKEGNWEFTDNEGQAGIILDDQERYLIVLSLRKD